MAQPNLGILTLYLSKRNNLEERPVYAKMIAAGQKIGISVFVFTPQDVDDQKNLIYAHFYNPASKSWSRRWVRFPHMIYDRCRIQRSERFQQLLAFRRRHAKLHFLNRPLRNKWTIYRALAKVPAFKQHLPVTRLYESSETVQTMLRSFSTLYLKPINGTGGRGIMRIDRTQSGALLLQGRDHSRHIVSPRQIARSSLSSELNRWDKHGDRYIVQQGLQIKLPSGRIHDYRMLVQKNGAGEWEVTGCAGRVGPSGSITSNLHGGGRAVPMQKLLKQWIGNESDMTRARNTAEQLSLGIARYLDNSYGGLCELALDLAIDHNGRVWLLEVNPKPAREVFREAGEMDVYRKSITRPVQYALWFYQQRYGKTAAGQESRIP